MPIIVISVCLALVAVGSIQVQAQQAYQTSALNSHNTHRAKHQVPALKMDNNLNNLAVQCANHYAKIKTIDHSCPYKGGAGENLVGGSGTWTPQQFADMGTKAWYDEVQHYNFGKPGFSMATGHFTQLVWKASTTFGFGVASFNGYTAGVALYSPHGNVQGQFPQNVLRAK